MIQQTILTIQFVFRTPELLLLLVVSKIKSSRDILQGISKLDYLLKVSEFQQYKDSRNRVGHRLTIGPATSFERLTTSLCPSDAPEGSLLGLQQDSDRTESISE